MIWIGLRGVGVCSLLFESGMIVRCARVRRTSPDGVSTRYDLGVSAGAVTRPCNRLPLVVIQTGESFGMGRSDLAVVRCRCRLL